MDARPTPVKLLTRQRSRKQVAADKNDAIGVTPPNGGCNNEAEKNSSLAFVLKRQSSQNNNIAPDDDSSGENAAEVFEDSTIASSTLGWGCESSGTLGMGFETAELPNEAEESKSKHSLHTKTMLRRKESQKENILDKGNDGDSDLDKDEASSSGEEGELKANKSSSAKRVFDAKKLLKKQGSRIKLALEMSTDDSDHLKNGDKGDTSRPAFSKRLLKKQNSRKKIEMDMVVEKEEESDESDGEGESIDILDESMDDDGDGMANAKSSIRSNAPTRRKSMSPMREAKDKEETATNTKHGDDAEDSHPLNLKTSAILKASAVLRISSKVMKVLDDTAEKVGHVTADIARSRNERKRELQFSSSTTFGGRGRAGINRDLFESVKTESSADSDYQGDELTEIPQSSILSEDSPGSRSLSPERYDYERRGRNSNSHGYCRRRSASHPDPRDNGSHTRGPMRHRSSRYRGEEGDISWDDLDGAIERCRRVSLEDLKQDSPILNCQRNIPTAVAIQESDNSNAQNHRANDDTQMQPQAGSFLVAGRNVSWDDLGDAIQASLQSSLCDLTMQVVQTQEWRPNIVTVQEVTATNTKVVTDNNGPWTCAICTVVNENGSVMTCAVCENPRGGLEVSSTNVPTW